MINRLKAERRGRLGEDIAAWWLRLQGWRILAKRVKTVGGEVDLIAKRGRTVAFIEVKTRATAAELDLAIDRNRLRRVAAAATALSARYAKNGEDITIDVILLRPFAWPRRIANAWQ